MEHLIYHWRVFFKVLGVLFLFFVERLIFKILLYFSDLTNLLFLVWLRIQKASSVDNADPLMRVDSGKQTKEGSVTVFPSPTI